MVPQLRILASIALAALALAAPAQGVIAIIFDARALTSDISSLVPSVLQTSLLAKVDTASMAAARGQGCTTARILGALEHEVRAKGDAATGDPNLIGDGSVRVLVAEIDAALAALPSDSCPSDPS